MELFRPRSPVFPLWGLKAKAEPEPAEAPRQLTGQGGPEAALSWLSSPQLIPLTWPQTPLQQE